MLPSNRYTECSLITSNKHLKQHCIQTPQAFFKSSCESFPIASTLVSDKITFILLKSGTKHVSAFSPLSKPYDTVPFTPSERSFLRFINLSYFLSYRLFRVGAVTRQRAVLSKVLEKLIPCSMFSCTFASR